LTSLHFKNKISVSTLNNKEKKMKTKTLKTVFASLFLFGLTLFVRSPQAFAATKTWDGGGSDNNMNTAEP